MPRGTGLIPSTFPTTFHLEWSWATHAMITDPAQKACPGCGRQVDTAWSFCKWCGRPLSQPPETAECSACGHALRPGDIFCRACGNPIQGVPVVAGLATSPSAEEQGEARQAEPSSRVRRLFWPALIGLGVGGVLALLLAQVIGAGSGPGDDQETVASASSLPVVTGLAEVQATSIPVPAITTTTTNTVATTPATTSTIITTSTTTVGVPFTTVPGDLGLSVPMLQPLCDGTYVVFIGASVNPDEYATEISDYLARYPASNYLRTDVTCSSLRPQTESGDAIYAAYFGPFLAFEHACNAADDGPSGSYVKRLDNTTDPSEILECP